MRKKYSVFPRSKVAWPARKFRGKVAGKKKILKLKAKPFKTAFPRGRSYSKFGLKRPNYRSNFVKRVKDVIMNQVASENSYLENYIDVVTTAAEAKDAIGNQAMWNQNQTAASGGLAGSAFYNLMIHDPRILSLISQNISAVQTTKATIKTYSVAAKLINSGTAPLTVWEYRCRARNNLSLDLATLLTGGFGDATTGIGAKPTSTLLGATPFNNPAYCAQFKIVKVRKWNLKPAQTKDIKYVNSRDFQFTQETISPDGNIMSTLRGREHSLFVLQGSFGYLASNTDGKRYGIVAPHLGIVYTIRVHYSWINDENISQGSNVYITGLTRGPLGTNTAANVPCPVVINHPDSSIADGVGGAAAGTRAYAGTEVYAVESMPFTIN